MSEHVNEVITDGAPNTVRAARDLKYELAATVAQLLRKKRAKKEAMKEFKAEIDDLETRCEDLVGQIEQGGTQLSMHFSTQADAGDVEVDEDPEEEGDDEDADREH